MEDYLEPLTFSVALGLKAHCQAIQHSQDCNLHWKMQQVYLNTLAIYAVDFYLKSQGFSTDWKNCDSQDAVKRILLDVADLQIKNCGYLECRPVLANAEFLYVPADVWSGRVAYVAVEVDADLKEAKLLGFVKEITAEKIPLTQLQSLTELSPYLRQRQTTNSQNLLSQAIAAGKQLGKLWSNSQPLEPAFNFRGGAESEIDLASDTRHILLEFAGDTVDLMVILYRQNSFGKYHIVTIKLTTTGTYLPTGLQLAILDEDNNIVMEAEAKKDTENIKFELAGKTGDRFSLKVCWGEIMQGETFII